MKKLLSKAAAYLLVLAVILGTGNLLPIGMPVKAEGITTVNVYDATTFGEMLKTENVDIVLWQDISYEGTDTVLCNSVDLNGHNLTFSNTLTLGSGKRTFSIIDSQYSSGSSNTATFSEGINIDDGTLKIKSGVISVLRNTTKKVNPGIYGTGNVEFIGGKTTIKGGTGAVGSQGWSGKSGNTGSAGELGSLEGRGGNGGNGGTGKTGDKGYDGGDGIQVTNVTVYGGNVTVSGGIGGIGGIGGTGGNGGTGGRGAHGNAGYGGRGGNGGTGGNGGNGGTGGIGGSGIQATNVTIYGGELAVRGGKGGNGGIGGTGGTGGTGGQGGYCYEYGKGGGNGGAGGNGGNGGTGGNGGNGGNGILATDVRVYGGNIISYGGYYGRYGGSYVDRNNGTGGIGGRGGKRGDYNSGISGKNGSNGSCGSYGIDGASGGAGIHARLTVEAGTVSAVGEKWSAGIGGTGNGQGIEGTDVTISGGTVTVAAGEKSFGIGGGFDGTKTGVAGKLTVSGGTLILSTSGSGTNATVPTFTNCTVSGEGASQYEGTYNADGKFTVSAVAFTTNPIACECNETVTLIAYFDVSRKTNITTPAPCGSVSFELDGEKIGTAPLTKIDTGINGYIRTIAELEWTVSNIGHTITAEYISGSGDKYISTGRAIYEVSAHEHIWDDDFTIDKVPDCINKGLKSIHCTLCDAKKDETLIEALGHEYSSEWTIEQEATCTNPGSKSHHCIRCDEKTDITEIPATHTFGLWEEKISPSCNTYGTSIRTCSVCGYSETRTVPMRHTEVEIPEIKATCTGTGLTAGKMCSDCGKILKKQEVTPMLSHNYVTTIIPPTKNSQGYSLHTCSACGDSYKDRYTEYVSENIQQIIIESKSAVVGKTVTINFFVKNNPGFNAASIKIDYDATRLKLIGMELSETFCNEANVSYDLPHLTFVRSNNINFDTNMLTATFEVLDTAVIGDAYISLSYPEGDISNINGENVNFKIVDGKVKVVDYLTGDINGDGTVDIRDLIRLKKILSGQEEDSCAPSDIDGNGTVDAVDLTELKKLLMNAVYKN